MDKIYTHRVYVDKSQIHGLGVFASEDIKEGEVFERTPILRLPTKRGDTNYVLIDYTFIWPRIQDWREHVLPMGFGCLYNHSDNPNADWRSNEEEITFEFFAKRDIKKDEEILIYYGNDLYWQDGRNQIEVK